MARFLIDEQLPPSLARLLKRAGHHAVHIYNLGLGAESDRRIWSEAMARNAILVTKDADFVKRRLASRRGPPVLWIRLGNTSSAALEATLAANLDDLVIAFAGGEILIELR